MTNPRFSILSLTDAAAARAREIIAGAGHPVAGIRVGVKRGGCAGMSYTMNLAEKVGDFDEVVEDHGVKILVAPADLMFLLGTKLDFETSKLGASFTFRNPNEISACGCGQSVALTPAAPGSVEQPARA